MSTAPSLSKDFTRFVPGDEDCKISGITLTIIGVVVAIAMAYFRIWFISLIFVWYALMGMASLGASRRSSSNAFPTGCAVLAVVFCVGCITQTLMQFDVPTMDVGQRVGAAVGLLLAFGAALGAPVAVLVIRLKSIWLSRTLGSYDHVI